MSTGEVLKKGTGNRWEMRFLEMPQISETFQPGLTPEKGRAAWSNRCPYTDVQEESKNGEGQSEFPGNKVNTRRIFLLLCGFGKNNFKKIY